MVPYYDWAIFAPGPCNVQPPRINHEICCPLNPCAADNHYLVFPSLKGIYCMKMEASIYPYILQPLRNCLKTLDFLKQHLLCLVKTYNRDVHGLKSLLYQPVNISEHHNCFSLVDSTGAAFLVLFPWEIKESQWPFCITKAIWARGSRKGEGPPIMEGRWSTYNGSPIPEMVTCSETGLRAPVLDI